jgi:hypothetical protein
MREENNEGETKRKRNAWKKYEANMFIRKKKKCE